MLLPAAPSVARHNAGRLFEGPHLTRNDADPVTHGNSEFPIAFPRDLRFERRVIVRTLRSPRDFQIERPQIPFDSIFHASVEQIDIAEKLVNQRTTDCGVERTEGLAEQDARFNSKRFFMG